MLGLANEVSLLGKRDVQMAIQGDHSVVNGTERTSGHVRCHDAFGLKADIAGIVSRIKFFVAAIADAMG